MDDILKTAMRVAYVFVAACLLVWAIIPEWRTWTAGVMLGVAASAFNAYLLRRRVELLSVKVTQGQPRKAGLGMAGRLATVLLAAMTAYRFPELFSLPATLLACFFVQVVAPFVAMIHNVRHNR